MSRRKYRWSLWIGVVLAQIPLMVMAPVQAAPPVAATPPRPTTVDNTPWTLPSMPPTCTSDKAKSGDVTGCLLTGPGGSPTKRGFGEAPFPWAEAGAELPWVDLAAGSSGRIVLALQAALAAAGLDVVEDGSFGSMTTKAVKAFQTELALPVTGIVDAATAAALGVVNSEPGPFPPAGFNWSGWGYNGSPAVVSWETNMVRNAKPIGPVAAGRLQGHKEALGLFEGFVGDLVAGGYPLKDIGMYVFRCTSNSRKTCEGLTPTALSNHAYGLALDMNTWANPELTYRGVDGATACAVPQKTDIAKWVVDAAQRWGLFWSGYGYSGGCKTPSDVKSSVLRDPMHFEFRGDVNQARAILSFNAGQSSPLRVCANSADDGGVIRRVCSGDRTPPAGWRIPIDVGAPAGATAVLVNIALTEATAPGFVTAESCGPVAGPARQWANGNFPAAGTVSNLSVVPLDANGKFCLFNSAPVQSIVDVQGFFVPAATAGSAGFIATPQQRVLDTRTDGASRVNAATALPLPTLGDMPSGASAVLVNTAVTGPSAAGFVTADRCSKLATGYPTSANVNFTKDMTVANLAVVPVAGGPTTNTTCLWPMVATHLVVDTQGAFVPNSGLGLSIVGPKRLADTRECAFHGGAERCGQRVEAGQMLRISGARGTAALVNLALTDSTGDLFAIADRCDVLETDRPLRANANTSAGRTISNLAVVPVGPDGTFCVWVSAPTHIVVDIQGVFEDGGSLRFVGRDPNRRHDTRIM